MPNFFFDVYDGKTNIKTKGTNLPTWQEARTLAIRYMGEIFCSEANDISQSEDWHMNVTNEDGLVLMRLDFSILLSPSIDYTNILRNDNATHLARTFEEQPATSNDC